MAVATIYDPEGRIAALYCTTTGWAFGPVFTGDDAEDTAEAFLDWFFSGKANRVAETLGLRPRVAGDDGRDPRAWSDGDLEKLTGVYRGAREAERHASGETVAIACRLPYGPHAVLVDGEPAPFEASLRLRNHSRTGFSWGYTGSGPAQTALAVLYEVLVRHGHDPGLPAPPNVVEHELPGDSAARVALRLYQDFKREHVATWPQTDHVAAVDVRGWIAAKLAAEVSL